MNIQLIKAIDAKIGRFVASVLPSPSLQKDDRNPHSILLIRPGGIGDAVLLAPAIGALKKKFPYATITVLAEKRNAGIFNLISSVDRVLCYDVLGEFLAAFRLDPDLIIDTEQYHRLSAVVARLTGAANLIGYATNERARLFHHAIPYSQDNYEVNSFFGLLAPLGLSQPASIDSPFLSVPSAAQDKAKQLLTPLAGRTIVSLFPGASIQERRWGAERFGQVATQLRLHGYGIVVVGGKEDIATGSAIIRGGGFNLAGLTSLTETAAILEQSALLISGDSGVLHLGVGVGIPTVSLFGPGIAQKWAPRGPQHLVLNQKLDCSPCTQFGYTQKCPRQAACLQQISPNMVVEAALLLLPDSDQQG